MIKIGVVLPSGGQTNPTMILLGFGASRVDLVSPFIRIERDPVAGGRQELKRSGRVGQACSRIAQRKGADVLEGKALGRAHGADGDGTKIMFCRRDARFFGVGAMTLDRHRLRRWRIRIVAYRKFRQGELTKIDGPIRQIHRALLSGENGPGAVMALELKREATRSEDHLRHWITLEHVLDAESLGPRLTQGCRPEVKAVRRDSENGCKRLNPGGGTLSRTGRETNICPDVSAFLRRVANTLCAKSGRGTA